MPANRLAILFDKHLNDTLSAEEHVELMGLLLEPSLQDHVKALTEAAFDANEQALLPEERQQTILQNIFASATPAPVIDIRSKNTPWKKWIIAASVLLVLSIGSYFLFFNNDKAQGVTPPTTQLDIHAPQKNRAMITLGDGRVVYIDSINNGGLLSNGGIEIVKMSDGKIEYRGNSREVQYNTLTNPRGSTVIDMIMSDGSHVWLNAGSSITYPVVFSGAERRVNINGEAYFEIAHNASKPFFVTKNDVQVQVLGTHFNVNAYDDEESLKVTLLEGSVRVKSETDNRKSEVVIKPGQQAVIRHPSAITVSNVNTGEVMSWKEGMFHFENAPMQAILREVARWYNVEVKYESLPAGEPYFVLMKRTNSLSAVLKALEASDVKFNITGNTLTVKK